MALTNVAAALGPIELSSLLHAQKAVREGSASRTLATAAGQETNSSIRIYKGAGRRHLHSNKKLRAVDENQEASSTSQEAPFSSGEGPEDLAAKLAAAEAEAAALRRELESRRSGSSDLSKMKPASGVKFDGEGFRETLFDGPKTSGKLAKKGGASWGFSEAELFISKGAPTEGLGLQGRAMEEGAEEIVRRNLLIGLGLTAVTAVLATVDLPLILSTPSKPLFFYVVPLIELRDKLELLNKRADSYDVFTFRAQLRITAGSSDELRSNLLSVVSLLEGPNRDAAKALAFEIVDFLRQADYSNYFENLGNPLPAQQLEFLKFSRTAIQTANGRLKDFLSLVPREVVDAAITQIQSRSIAVQGSDTTQTAYFES